MHLAPKHDIGPPNYSRNEARMILYPAIDLKDGKAVRLYKGEMEKATIFHDYPATQALTFEKAGC